MKTRLTDLVSSSVLKVDQLHEKMNKIRDRVVISNKCGLQTNTLNSALFYIEKGFNVIPLYSVDSEYLMLIFWDPDCGHCKKEMPKLKAIYDKYKDKGLQVYTVCTEVEKDKWLKYIEEKEYDWIDVADFELRSPFRELYDISSTPKVFLLDKNKKIIAKHINHEQLDKILERKLK